MLSKSFITLALCQYLAPFAVQAAVTWPSPIDEIEDLMLLQSGYRARGFATAVIPCSKSYNQGFRAAAGFMRTAFQDVAAFDASTGLNGLDASIGFELQFTNNNGPAFDMAMVYLHGFFNGKATMSDLIALSVYASVRSCGGPVLPVKAGRIDATGTGPNGLPDPADSRETLIGRFAKMGFSPQEMIQLVACGHTLGGVHPGIGSNFNPRDPAAVQQAVDGGVQTFDTGDASFDAKIAAEYSSGISRNPLVVGRTATNSDLRVFSVDNNATIRSMATANVFTGTCQTVLTKMLEKVPRAVQLSAVIQAYDVKPGYLNLNVVQNGAALVFSGEIRVRTTTLSVSSVKLIYTGRAGDACTDCTITTTKGGAAAGFDDTFNFYQFSRSITSITTFEVVVTTTSGQVVSFNNNGAGFPVNDAAFVQLTSSSLTGSELKVVVAKRNSELSVPEIVLSTRSAQVFNTLPTVSRVSQGMTVICSDSIFTYYTGTFSIGSSQVDSAKLDVSLAGTVVDGFRSINFPSTGQRPSCIVASSSSTTTTTTTTAGTTTTTTTTADTTTTTTTPGSTTASTTTTADTSTTLSTTPSATVATETSTTTVSSAVDSTTYSTTTTPDSSSTTPTTSSTSASTDTTRTTTTTSTPDSSILSTTTTADTSTTLSSTLSIVATTHTTSTVTTDMMTTTTATSTFESSVLSSTATADMSTTLSTTHATITTSDTTSAVTSASMRVSSDTSISTTLITSSVTSSNVGATTSTSTTSTTNPIASSTAASSTITSSMVVVSTTGSVTSSTMKLDISTSSSSTLTSATKSSTQSTSKPSTSAYISTTTRSRAMPTSSTSTRSTTRPKTSTTTKSTMSTSSKSAIRPTTGSTTRQASRQSMVASGSTASNAYSSITPSTRRPCRGRPRSI